MLFTLKGISGPVEFTGCDEVARGVASILRGWDMREIPSESAAPAVIRLRKTERGYQRISPRIATPSLCRDQIRVNKVSAVCGMHSELVRRYLAENPSLTCLHVGAVEFAGGLVLFSGTYRTGKSTLAVALAAAGMRLFCDDVLLLDHETNHGVAMGLAPRLRLPLPEGMGGAFHDFVRARTGPRNKASQYVDLAPGELAELGASAPIIGIVKLARDDASRPALIPTLGGEILKDVVLRNIAHEVPALDILDRLYAIVEGAKCFTLRYARCGEAVTLLRDQFGRAAERSVAA